MVLDIQVSYSAVIEYIAFGYAFTLQDGLKDTKQGKRHWDTSG